MRSSFKFENSPYFNCLVLFLEGEGGRGGEGGGEKYTNMTFLRQNRLFFASSERSWSTFSKLSFGSSDSLLLLLLMKTFYVCLTKLMHHGNCNWPLMWISTASIWIKRIIKNEPYANYKKNNNSIENVVIFYRQLKLDKM